MDCRDFNYLTMIINKRLNGRSLSDILQKRAEEAGLKNILVKQFTFTSSNHDTFIEEISDQDSWWWLDILTLTLCLQHRGLSNVRSVETHT